MTNLILFDFDGVIVDSFEACMQINQLNDPALTPEQYRTMFEGNVYAYLAKNGPKDTPDTPDYWDRYGALLHELDLVPGMEDVIKKLAEDNVLAIVSSSFESVIVSYLEARGLTECFAEIYGKETHYSKVEKLGRLLKEYECAAADALFITDTLGDLREAEEVGIPCIGVAWGFHATDRLEQGKSLGIVHTPEQLVAAITAHRA